MKPTPEDSLFWFFKKYPVLSEVELEKMKEFLDGYAELLLSIFERTETDLAFRVQIDALIEKNRKQENQGI
jgi:hypothetical protein